MTAFAHTESIKENDMGAKEIINRLYAYKDESNDERLNDLIDDVIKLIIDLKWELKGE